MDDLKRPGTTPEANITVGGPNGVKNTPVSAQLTNRKLANARRAITDALNSRRVKPSKLIFISLAAAIIVAGVSFYFVHNQKSTGSAVLTATGQTCGVHLNSNGTFTFSWLHINSTGQVVDSTGCVVRLLGVNEGAPFLGGASGTTDLAGLAAKMKWYHNALPANIARVNYNTYWWDTDVYVPDAHMHFKQWLQTYVKLLEQSGDYVELDTGPEFHNPPCGNDGMGVNITFCPSQNQATKNIPTNPQEQIWYEPTALQSLSELSKIYANDPAILFNVWNEPAASAITLTQYMTDMNERINAVRANAKNSICVVYVRYLDQIMAGQAQLYTQPNLIIDQHDYGVPNVAALQPKFAYYKAHGLGAIFNEYGGAIYNPAAEPVFTQLAQQYGVGMVYFFYSNLNSATTQNPTNALNANGQLVHQSYTTIFGSAPPAPAPGPNPTPTPAPEPSPGPTMPAFSHIFTIVMENKGNSLIAGNSQAPYINSLIKKYGYASNYFAVGRPSLPNYLGLTGGSTFGHTSDCLVAACPVSATNIADELESAGLTWKAYMESMPTPCSTTDTTLYAQKHNPFVYYDDIHSSTGRCSSHDVPYTQFAGDLNGNIPDYAFITPNLIDDMHDGTVSQGDAWLSSNVPAILNSSAWKNNGLLVIVWDEQDGNSGGGVTAASPAILISPLSKPGYTSNIKESHYSLLRTVEDNWNLTPLANSASASAMNEYFNNGGVNPNPSPSPSPSPTPSPSPNPSPNPGPKCKTNDCDKKKKSLIDKIKDDIKADLEKLRDLL